jgi:tRNA U38,U39,U40 pseudouridine synthase TruA
MVEGVEFVTLGVIGQSFVLNQIRKMVGTNAFRINFLRNLPFVVQLL